MKKTILLLIFLCLYFSEIYSQETFSKDSIRNNYGIYVELESGFTAAFIQFGIDYNHRINKRFSFGGATSFGVGGADDNCYKLNIMPYIRVDLMKKKFSPFIDFGVGYDMTYWKTTISSYQNLIDKHTSKNFFISSRLGVCLISKKFYNISLVIQYQKFFPKSGFTGFGFIYNLKR